MHNVIMYIAFVFEQFLAPCLIELLIFFIVKCIKCFM